MALIDLLPPNLQSYPNIMALCEALDAGFQVLPDYDSFFLYDIDNVDPAYLPWLAWQFHVDGYNQANTETQKRDLVKKATALHRYKGTPWALKEALKAIGYYDLVINEGIEPIKHGEFNHSLNNIHRTHNNWAAFQILVDIGENRPISVEETFELLRIVNEYKNERSRLENISRRLTVIDTGYIDEHGDNVIEVTTIDGIPWGRRYDGTWNHGRAGRVFHDGSFYYDGSWIYSGLIQEGSIYFSNSETLNIALTLRINDDFSVYPVHGSKMLHGHFYHGRNIDFLNDSNTYIKLTETIRHGKFGHDGYLRYGSFVHNRTNIRYQGVRYGITVKEVNLL